MRFARRFSDIFALVLTILWALGLTLLGSTEVLLYLAPALLIVAPLLAGRYPGDSLIGKLTTKCSPRSSKGSLPVVPTLSSRVAALPRGTRLLAFSLAKRPPPLHLSVHT
jgi:hypothetical protein